MPTSIQGLIPAPVFLFASFAAFVFNSVLSASDEDEEEWNTKAAKDAKDWESATQ